MRFSKAARYALLAATEMACVENRAPVTVTVVARRYRIPEAALAKVLQRLVHSGLVVGVRGVHGGYQLARRPSEITILDVLDVFEPDARSDPAGDESGLPPGLHPVGTLFERVDRQLRSTFSSVTLAALAAGEGTALTTARPGR